MVGETVEATQFSGRSSSVNDSRLADPESISENRETGW